MSCFDSVGDRHRAFALAVDLREPRPEAVERLQRVLDIHRRAALDDGADVVGSDIAAGHSTSRLTMVGAANIDMRGQARTAGRFPPARSRRIPARR